MTSPEDRDTSLPPLETKPARVSAPETVAAGLPALTSSAQHALGEMGLARSVQVLKTLNQDNGFDCPGCAWPEPQHRSAFEFCENGVKAVAEEATRKRADPDFFAAHSLRQLADLSDHDLGKSGRITHPMVLRPGDTHYRPISWDDAFALIAEHLKALPSPDRAVFYTSGRTSNEAAFLWQLFVRRFGTNNLPDCSNMCHESSGVALKETLGVGKGTVGLHDFEQADAILVFGQNPGTNHPRMLTALQAAARRGCRIVSINPLPEAGLSAFIHPQEPVSLLTGHPTPLACLHVPVTIGGDIALLKGVLKELIANDKVDHGFIAEHTDGYEALRADIEASSWDDIVAGSGVDRETIHAMAKIVGDAKRVICCWAMGLTQHEEAVGTIQMVVNLLLLGGHMGRPGAGACPVRGHSNVQGDRTMGIYEKMPDPFLDRLGATFGFEPPRRHGLDTIDTIKAMRAGNIDVFFAMGGNFLSAAPDTLATAEGLRNCRLTVHVSTKPNRSHVVHGETALILPCLGRTERDQPVSVEDSMSMVHLSRGTLEPVSEHLLAEVAIVCRVADAVLGPDSGIPWKSFSSDYDQIREKIEAVVPGFENFNQRVRQPGGFLLPNGARERSFDTATGQARFTVHAIPLRERPQGSLVMMTIRTHDQYNTTVYGLDDRYRGIHGGRRVVLMNGNDQAAFGVSSGDRVDLVSRYDGVERRAEGFQVVDYPIPPGCCATYFPEANVLVPLGRSARKSNTPISKSVVVFVEKPGNSQSTQS